MKMKSVCGGILGIAGGALIMISGVIIFAQLMSFGLFHPIFAVLLILYVASGAFGIAGGAVALTRNHMLGGVLQVVGIVFGVVGLILAFSVLAIIAGVLMLAGMIVTFAVKKPVDGNRAPCDNRNYRHPYDPYDPYGRSERPADSQPSDNKDEEK